MQKSKRFSGSGRRCQCVKPFRLIAHFPALLKYPVPILSRWGNLKSRQLYATCVAVIFPVCAVSAAMYLWRGGMNWASALPYLAGGLLGGWLGGKLYGRVSAKVLKWIFAAFLFYAGVRYLL